MTVQPHRFLLVELAENLAEHYTTWSGVMAIMSTAPGVASVTDLAYVSQDTLDVFLNAPPVFDEEPEEDVYQMELGA